MIVILMGPAGAGKTTVGQRLAEAPGWDFVDGDAFHSPANVEKIRRGEALTDVDRALWLQALQTSIEAWLATDRSVILACSALKQRYRENLRVSPEIRFVYLRADPDVLYRRLQNRVGHFASEAILSSQLADLEEPEPREALIVDASQEADAVVEAIRAGLSLTG